MDYGRPDRADRLAAVYVLGTLRGPARRRLQALLPAHPRLRHAVTAWEGRLATLASTVPPVEPPDAVWRGIERRLFGPATSPAPPPWWQRLAPWRWLAGVATTAAVVLGVVSTAVPPAQPPVVIVLAATPDAARVLPASFVASVTADGRALVLRPLAPLTPPGGRALELWAVPPQGTPRSLGLVSATGATTVLRTQLLRDTAAFAVSVEPAGGSPSGTPTGPIVSLGQLPS